VYIQRRRRKPPSKRPRNDAKFVAPLGSFGLPAEEWQALVDAVADHRYNLLLGAGASFGAVGGDGKPLPLADQLRSDLCDQFRLPAGELRSLPEAYEEARHSKGPRDVNSYLKARFTGRLLRDHVVFDTAACLFTLAHGCPQLYVTRRSLQWPHSYFLHGSSF
jgi:hypothetical protein